MNQGDGGVRVQAVKRLVSMLIVGILVLSGVATLLKGQRRQRPQTGRMCLDFRDERGFNPNQYKKVAFPLQKNGFEVTAPNNEGYLYITNSRKALFIPGNGIDIVFPAPASRVILDTSSTMAGARIELTAYNKANQRLFNNTFRAGAGHSVRGDNISRITIKPAGGQTRSLTYLNRTFLFSTCIVPAPVSPRPGPPDEDKKPDLAIELSLEYLKEEQRVKVDWTVENTGNARSPTVKIVVSSGMLNWKFEDEQPPFSEGERRNFYHKVEPPEEFMGRSVFFRGVVDPDNNIAELNEENNAMEKEIFIARAEPPEEKQPNMAINLNPRYAGEEGRLLVDGFVENTGNARSPEVRVLLSCEELNWRRDDLMPPFGQGEVREFHYSLAVPGDIRGRRIVITGIVDPGNTITEMTKTDNRVTREIPLPAMPVDRVTPFPGGLVLIGAALLLFLALMIRYYHSRKGRMRLRWQEEASEEALLEECKHCTRYCHKKVKLVLAFQQITKIYLSFCSPGDGSTVEELALKGKPVKKMKRAAWAYQRGESTEKYEKQVNALAILLLEAIKKWADGLPVTRDVKISAFFEGCKMKVTFTLYHCLHNGVREEWKKESRWKKTFTVTRHQPVALVPALDLSKPEAFGGHIEDLKRQLMEFIESDVV
jgi:hypothetical protein